MHIRAPKALVKERKLKAWYRMNCGIVPPNWRDHPYCEAKIHPISIPIDPAAIQKLEEKIPTFEEKYGVKPEDIFKWNYSTLIDLCKICPEAMATLLMEYRYKIVFREKTDGD
jgi:hypothetical protein